MYAVVDVELANPREKGSICSIGIVWVSDNQIVDRFYSLVRPLVPFSPYCVQIHQITEEDVLHAPTFEELWPQLFPLLENIPLIAYHAETDIYAIERAIYNANLPAPHILYADALKIAKCVIDLDGYSLSNVANFLGIPLVNAHNALSDAETTAYVMIAIQEHFGFSDLDEVLAFCRLPVCDSLTNAYEPDLDLSYQPKEKIPSKRFSRRPVDLAPPIPLCHGNCDYFSGKYVLLTGNLKCTTREMAQKAITEMGGICKNSASKKINICIAGSYDKDTLRPGDTIGKKLQLILEYNTRGLNIDILTEEEFLEILAR
ncbi:MAG: exonuclease domain-containing protein [Clostridia bacterium]|nr:exonuclease domain-containing protein [Clostridia bacterium]